MVLVFLRWHVLVYAVGYSWRFVACLGTHVGRGQNTFRVLYRTNRGWSGFILPVLALAPVTHTKTNRGWRKSY